MSPEIIPDADELYRRIHRHFFDPDSGRVSFAAFDGEELSVNWQRYSSPEHTVRLDSTGNTAAVAVLKAGDCRQLAQEVRHDPVNEAPGVAANLAHALVCGRKSRRVKQQLRDLCRLAWRAEGYA